MGTDGRRAVVMRRCVEKSKDKYVITLSVSFDNDIIM